MVIKIKSGNKSWRVWDEAEDTEYLDQPIHVKDENSLSELISKVDLRYSGEKITVLPVVDYPFYANIISFKSGEKEYVILFNTVCFLCSSTGKTIEKVKATKDK